MKRTQIYLDENLYQDLISGAKSAQITISEYIRRLIAKQIYFNKATDNSSSTKKSLLNIAKKSVSLGRKDLAKNFDTYLETSLV